MRRLLKSLGISVIAAIAAFPLVLALFMAPGTDNYKPIAHAQFGGNIPLDTQLCNTVGAIAVRQPTRWQCVAPGTNQQVFVSNGAGAVPGWTTPAGTGNVNAVPTPAANQVPFWASATTLKGIAPGGAALDAVNGANSVGYEKRTGTGAYSWAPIPAGDLPAISGSDCSIAVGAGAISCAGLLAQQHTFTAPQSVKYGNAQITIDNANVGYAGVQELVNGTLVGQILANGGQTYFDFSGGITFRAITNGYFVPATLDPLGHFTSPYLTPSNPVAVSYGGTNCTSAGGACLDNILGLTGTGLLQRQGANQWALAGISAYLDQIGSTQGSILYRSGSAWVTLPPASSAGQILASQGSGANPQWVAPGSVTPGTRVLLNTLTANNSATLQDTSSLTSNYAEYELDCEGISAATASAKFEMLVQQGGSFVATGYTGFAAKTNASGTASTYSDTSDMYLAQLDTSLNNLYAQIRFSNPTLATPLVLTGNLGYSLSSVQQVANLNTRTPAAVTTGFQLMMSSGNIASGVCKVYGWN